MGLPAPMVSAILVTAAEFGCGLMLVLGLFTRLAAIPLAITMVVAWATVHRHAFFLQNKGAEYVIVLLAATVALALSGPGAVSLDRRIWRRRPAAP
jgi:putative oxidoreductase